MLFLQENINIVINQFYECTILLSTINGTYSVIHTYVMGVCIALNSSFGHLSSYKSSEYSDVAIIQWNVDNLIFLRKVIS